MLHLTSTEPEKLSGHMWTRFSLVFVRQPSCCCKLIHRSIAHAIASSNPLAAAKFIFAHMCLALNVLCQSTTWQL